MLRAILLLGTGMALGYGLSVVEVGGRPLAHQLGALWQAPLVQRPLSSLRRQLPTVAQRLRHEVPRGLAKMQRLQRAHEASEAADADEAHSERDRRELDATLQGAQKRR